MLLGICGWINSGKDTVADYLVNEHGFKRESFAGTLKDAVSAVFGWDREMLEGRTRIARAEREKVDEWWAERLAMPNLSPRWVLQRFGTEVCRRNFHDDIWIASLENRLRNSTHDVVISDCRFPNEVRAIKSQGGRIIWVQRGEFPEWYEQALSYVRGESEAISYRSDVHPSEYEWLGTEFDAIIDNNGTIEQLYAQIKNLV